MDIDIRGHAKTQVQAKAYLYLSINDDLRTELGRLLFRIRRTHQILKSITQRPTVPPFCDHDMLAESPFSLQD